MRIRIRTLLFSVKFKFGEGEVVFPKRTILKIMTGLLVTILYVLAIVIVCLDMFHTFY